MPLRKSVAVAICALACMAASALPASAEAQVNPNLCGGQIAKSTGGYWTCTFADGFNGSALDRTKWSVMTTPTSGYTHALECYVDDPSTVAVGAGLLNLTARRLTQPAWCGSLFQTQYFSGMVHTKYSFAQTYGRYEARIKFPKGTGLHSSWWMWPLKEVYGVQSGEIDIAEHFGMFPELVSSYLHVKDAEGRERGRSGYCKVADPEGGFHNYTVEWYPSGRFVFLYDGRPCLTVDSWTPAAPLTHPQPFDQPFFMILTLALSWHGGIESTPLPATMQVEYVRAWR